MSGQTPPSRGGNSASRGRGQPPTSNPPAAAGRGQTSPSSHPPFPAFHLNAPMPPSASYLQHPAGLYAASRGLSPSSGPPTIHNTQMPRSTSNPNMPGSTSNSNMPRSTSNPLAPAGRGQSPTGGNPNMRSSTTMPRSTSNPPMTTGGQGQSRSGPRSFSDPRSPQTYQNRGSPSRPDFSPITPGSLSSPNPRNPPGSRTMTNPRALSYGSISTGGPSIASSQGQGSGQQQTLAIRSSQNDPPWPINRGYTCHKAWTPNQQQVAGNAIQVRAGDWGCILQQSNDKKLIYITIALRNVRGWAPRSQEFFKIGNTIYGRITHKGDFPIAPVNLTIDPNVEVAEGLYPQSVYAFLTALAQEADQIKLDSQSTATLRSGHYRAELTNRMERCAHRSGALDILNQPDFSLQDLQSALVNVKDQPRSEVDGLSVIYDQVIQLRNGEYQLRIGKTSNLYVRGSTHDLDIQNKLSRFHAAVSEAEAEGGTYSMSTLLQGLDGDEALTFAETATIVQFGSYANYLLLPAKPEDSANHTLNKFHAGFLTKLAKSAFASTGWIPATERPDFGCTTGWNITTPLFEMQQSGTIWSRTDSDTMATFRRSEVKVSPEGLVVRIASGGTKGGHYTFNSHLPQGSFGTPDSPAVGDEVFIVFEIMLNGERHPQGYGRLPEIGHWTDHNLAAGVALKVQWHNQKTGQWMERYNYYGLLRAEIYEGSFLSYSACMALRRFFLRQTCPNFRETDPELGHVWQYDFGGQMARVKKIAFDNLEQTLTATDETGSQQGKAPWRVLPATHYNQLLQAGANKQSINRSRKTDKCTLLGSWRCDFCLINGHECEWEAGNQDRCTKCYRYGIPCSKTAKYKDSLRRLLTVQGKGSNEWQVVQDPGLRRGTV